ncbi:unnamed protein product [Linum trigynum]|uniref:Secreted protein n=1 Tax=Linum trigynum TaxID=586398 RepID=A0AAV2GLG8_9ROSI
MAFALLLWSSSEAAGTIIETARERGQDCGGTLLHRFHRVLHLEQQTEPCSRKRGPRGSWIGAQLRRRETTLLIKSLLAVESCFRLKVKADNCYRGEAEWGRVNV